MPQDVARNIFERTEGIPGWNLAFDLLNNHKGDSG